MILGSSFQCQLRLPSIATNENPFAICTINLEAASYSSSSKGSARPDIYIYKFGWILFGRREKGWYNFKNQKKTNIIITETLKPFDSNQDPTLHDILVVWKSKKIIDVLSFVRNVLASLNKKLAIFSAELSSVDLSFVCQDKKFIDIFKWLGW